jgi:hypothetical protein
VLCSTTFQRFKATSTRAGGRCLSGPDYVSTFRDDAVRGAFTFRRFATNSSQIPEMFVSRVGHKRGADNVS